MQESDGGAAAITPQESWQAIHALPDYGDRARSSMYVAGTTAILLLWGAIASLGLISQYALESFGFVSRNPWIIGPTWVVLVTVGMVGSAVIGHRAGGRDAAGAAVRSAGIRVFLFWLAVAAVHPHPNLPPSRGKGL